VYPFPASGTGTDKNATAQESIPSLASRIDSLESIPGLLKRSQIWAQYYLNQAFDLARYCQQFSPYLLSGCGSGSIFAGRIRLRIGNADSGPGGQK
jgi:hypothetical protein